MSLVFKFHLRDGVNLRIRSFIDAPSIHKDLEVRWVALQPENGQLRQTQPSFAYIHQEPTPPADFTYDADASRYVLTQIIHGNETQNELDCLSLQVTVGPGEQATVNATGPTIGICMNYEPDIDIDSDNNRGLSLDGSAEEDTIENDPARPGKIIAVNEGDVDGDGIPDFADGFDFDGGTLDDDACSGLQFVEVKIRFVPASYTGWPVGEPLFGVTYDSSAPDQVSRSASGQYTVQSGSLRLWKSDGQQRDKRSIVDGGDFIPSTALPEYSADQLGLQQDGDEYSATFYLEGVAPSTAAGDEQITFATDYYGDSAVCFQDTVRVTILRHNLVGVCKLNEVEKGAAVALPHSFRKNLAATHLLFPANCQIDGGPNQAYGIIKLNLGLGTAVVPVDEYDEDCMSLTENIRIAYGIDQQEVAAGMWWQTPAYTAAGPQPSISLAAVDGENRHPLIGSTIRGLVKQPIRIAGPTTSVKFTKYEAEIVLDEDYFHHLGTGGKGLDQRERFDVYDADANFAKIAVDATFRVGGNEYHVPCFAMKDYSWASFKWKVRFSPPTVTQAGQSWELTVRAVVWHGSLGDTQSNYDEYNPVPGSNGQCYYHYYGYNNHNDPPVFTQAGNQHMAANAFYSTSGDDLPIPGIRFSCSAGTRPGPLRAPRPGENPHYLRRDLQLPGASEPVFLLGMAKPWDRQYDYPDFALGWEGLDLVDRNQLYQSMTGAGVNFDYVWFAPWECQLVHNKARSEFWYVNNVRQEHTEIVPASEWRGYAYYDQGRAARMDQIIAGHESNDIYVALSVWPHQSLQTSSHGWGETGWNQKDLDEEENGFSSLDLEIDNFFAAAQDVQGTNWLWQRNFYRYIMARWAYSRSIAMWVIVDELEGVGKNHSYWWGEQTRTKTYPWHDEVLKALRSLDWTQRPITTSTTYWTHNQDPYLDTEPTEGRDGEWVGDNETIDILSHHAYHHVWYWQNGMQHAQTNTRHISSLLQETQSPIWHYLSARMFKWVENTASHNLPWLVTEYGLYERDNPTDFTPPAFDSRLARSYVHFAAWSAFASGHAGIPLKWCDGLNYGEMFPRGNGPFQAGAYPDLGAELGALRSFISNTNLDAVSQRCTFEVTAPGGGDSPVRCWGLRSQNGIIAYVFDDDFVKTQDANWGNSSRTYENSQQSSKQDHTITFTGLVPNTPYLVKWFNTWDAGGFYDSEKFSTEGTGALSVPVKSLSATTRDPNGAWDGADAVLTVEQTQLTATTVSSTTRMLYWGIAWGPTSQQDAQTWSTVQQQAQAGFNADVTLSENPEPTLGVDKYTRYATANYRGNNQQGSWLGCGYWRYYIPDELKCALQFKLRVAGKHYRWIGQGPVRVDSGWAKIHLTGSPGTYASGADLRLNITPHLTVQFSDLNQAWANSGLDWFNTYPAAACYVEYDLPPEIVRNLQGNNLYLWFMYDTEPLYPWFDQLGVYPRGHERQSIFAPELWINH